MGLLSSKQRYGLRVSVTFEEDRGERDSRYRSCLRHRAGMRRGAGRRRPAGGVVGHLPAVEQVAAAVGMPAAVVDVCDDAALPDAVAAADRALDGIDGLVHAAGRVLAEPVGAYTAESWDAILDVNLRAHALLVQLLLLLLQDSARGPLPGRRRHRQHRRPGG